jgi:universal stress protein E
VNHFKHILCILGGGELPAALLERAVSLAENNQARLTCAEAIPELPAGLPPPRDPSWAADPLARLRSERLAALEAATRGYGDRVPIACQVLVGLPFIEIVRAVLREGHDLILKEAEDPGFLSRLFGSEDMRLLRKCPCPVWLTKPGGSANYSTILASVDLDVEGDPPEVAELTRRILTLASSLAVSDFAALHVLHVWNAPGEKMIRLWSEDPDLSALHYVEGERQRRELGMERLKRQLQEALGEKAFAYLSPHFHLIHGAAPEAIPAMAARLQADLVVMGTLGRSGIAGLIIGNTAEAVLEQLQCAVLAVKPSGFVSPVTL